jgi:hypothetical protein
VPRRNRDDVTYCKGRRYKSAVSKMGLASRLPTRLTFCGRVDQRAVGDWVIADVLAVA